MVKDVPLAIRSSGDDFVYVLGSEVEIRPDLPSGAKVQRIVGNGAVLISRGIWHAARGFAPRRMLFFTEGRGTQNRPAGAR